MVKSLRIAIEGCCHGKLDNIYKALNYMNPKDNKNVDLLIICGDFQAIRNFTDLKCMCCPEKYKEIGDFHKYYNGEKVAPVPTVFIGGNHEAQNHNRELYLGGWVAPNIYYLGMSNIIKFRGLRIGGISGIENDLNKHRGYYEKPPFMPIDRFKSMYHTRIFETIKLLKNKSKLDIFVSHDWPRNVPKLGNTQELLRIKPWFKSDINNNKLGSAQLEELINNLKPKYWFSAHMHVRFETKINWTEIEAQKKDNSTKTIQQEINNDEINIDFSDDSDTETDKVIGNVDEIVNLDDSKEINKTIPDTKVELGHTSETSAEYGNHPTKKAKVEHEEPLETNKTEPQGERITNFLSLDKCLPKRKFLEIIDINVDSENIESIGENNNPPKSLFQYDPEWIAILRTLQPLIPTERSVPPETITKWINLGDMSEEIENEKKKVLSSITDWNIPENFVLTAPGAKPGTPTNSRPRNNTNEQFYYNNPQTKQFCEKFGIVDLFSY
ncbi:hypothetical protein BB558_004688 [Smittium angustum]|nr:hypothetical protein BB558_004688 [Smittium angustum]